VQNLLCAQRGMLQRAPSVLSAGGKSTIWQIMCSTLRLFRGMSPIFPICRSMSQQVHLLTLDTYTRRGLVPAGALDTMIIDPSRVRGALHSLSQQRRL
jgi:hypothetical protein